MALEQWDREMPRRDLQSEMNDAYLAGTRFRWDSAQICFPLVFGLSTFQPPSLEAAVICGILYVLLCVSGRGER